MNPYLHRALTTYCDNTQTLYARDIARKVLLNAGYSEIDLRNAQAKGAENSHLFLFAA